MARTPLTKTAAPGKYASAGANVTLAAADVSNKNSYTAAGADLVIAHNTNAGAQTVTISSVADRYGRTGDIETHSIPAGEIAVFGPFPVDGWQQADGKIYLEASSEDVKLGVVSLPG